MQPFSFKRADRFFQMRKGRVGQAAEVDDVGAFPAIVLRALDDRLDRQRRGIDDLGEDLDIVFGHVDGLGGAAEKLRNVFQLIRPAHKGYAEFLAQAFKIGTAPPGQHDAIRLHWLRQTPRDDLLGHQGGDLHPDIQHLPAEARLHALQHRLEPRPCQMSGEEEDALGHGCSRSLSICRFGGTSASFAASHTGDCRYRAQLRRDSPLRMLASFITEYRLSPV